MKTKVQLLLLVGVSIAAAGLAAPPPGTLDLSFESQTSFTDCGLCLDGQVQRGLLIQPDDKVLVAGNGLRRLNADGQLDTNFYSGVLNPGSFIHPLVTDMALQDDGRILICGTFTNVHDTWRNGVARLYPDGRLDESFDPGSLIEGGVVQSIALQTNGQVLIAGTFVTVNGVLRRGVARLNADGSHDSSFNPGTGVTPTRVTSVMVQSGGKVLLAGDFTSVNGAARLAFARLHANGSVDSDFDPSVTVAVGAGASGLTPPRLLAVQPNGKIWITGQFGGTTNLVRLQTNGSADLQIVRLSFLLRPISLALQPNGKVIVGGRLSPMARLNLDGSVDSTFIPPEFHSSRGTSGPQFIALQSEGRIVVAGDFTSIVTSAGDFMSPGFARLFGADDLPFPPAIVSGSVRHLVGRGTSFRITGYPGSQVVTEAASRLDPPDWTPIRTNTIGTSAITITDTNAAGLPQRFYRLVSP